MIYDGRGGGIRTPDPLLPKQMRYQAALRPDDLFSIVARIAFRLAFGAALSVWACSALFTAAAVATNHTAITTSTAKIISIGAASSGFPPLRPASGNPASMLQSIG